MFFWLLFLHVLGASIWVGGHLVLLIRYVPNAILHKDILSLTKFEEKFEVVGIPALLTQVITGIIMALNFLPFSNWFETENPLSRLILIKLGLLLGTFLLALDARLRIIPNLSEKNILSLAWHVAVVTVISVLFVYFGLSFRF